MKSISLFCFFAILFFMGVSPAFSQTGATNAAGSDSVPGVYPLKARGITNFYQLNQKIYSGSLPEGDAGFSELKQLGVKTIISVDGLKPEVETAKRFGMRYVHLPFGYDGVPTNQALRLVKAAQTLPGPIFIHCHHGVNRGPVGAAIICMATENWTHSQAVAWLKLAGTGMEYSGLYQSVTRFKVPTPNTMSNVSDYFISEAAPSPLRDTMVEIDQRFSNLQLIRKANYTTPDQTSLSPEHESLVLSELFTELERSEIVTNRSEDFMADLRRAKTFANSLHNLLIASPTNSQTQTIIMGLRDDVFQEVGDSCKECHRDFRN